MENAEVKMSDITRLTVNMLKTNYISSNLAGYMRKLLRRTDKTELALLLSPMFEY